jgi:PhnB protein
MVSGFDTYYSVLDSRKLRSERIIYSLLQYLRRPNPTNMKEGTIYLNFNDNTEEVFNFYKAVLGGEFTYFSRFGDMPSQEGAPALPDEVMNRVMHVALQVNPGFAIFGSDTMPGMSPDLVMGSNISIYLNVESREEADRVFNALLEDGHAYMPMQETFWGAYFGQLCDKFGIQWMINWDVIS